VLPGGDWLILALSLRSDDGSIRPTFSGSARSRPSSADQPWRHGEIRMPHRLAVRAFCLHWYSRCTLRYVPSSILKSIALVAVTSLSIAGCADHDRASGDVPVGDSQDVTAGGPSTLRVPIVERIRVKKSKEVMKLIAERNADIKQAGLAEFP